MKFVKEQIARQFSRAASTYDEVAQLQCAMADRLIEQIPVDQTGKLVDFGCGTGYALEQISKFTELELSGIDIAPGMIEQARKRLRGTNLEVGDIEQSRFADRSIDVALSNAALQWCDTRIAFAEMARVLKPDGLFLASTFGPGTLAELKHAWQIIGDRRPRVHEFPSPKDLVDCLKAAGFLDVHLAVENRTLRFNSVRLMFQSMKQLGATNAASDRPAGLLGRERFLKLCAFLENQRRQSGHIEIGFECVYLFTRDCRGRVAPLRHGRPSRQVADWERRDHSFNQWNKSDWQPIFARN